MPIDYSKWDNLDSDIESSSEEIVKKQKKITKKFQQK